MVFPISRNISFDSEVVLILKKMLSQKPFECYFILKNLLKLLNAAYILKLYNPEQLISSCEYSYTSSILTWYCELKGIKHINVMHGEKLLDICNAFCRFSEFWVWDEHYIRMFKKLRAGESAFCVEVPPGFYLTTDSDWKEQQVDYKYYMQLESPESLQRLKKAIQALQQKGYSVKLRPHPLYTDVKLLNKYFDQSLIESSKEVEIKSSLVASCNVVSRYSTVLYQAYVNGINIVIDDYSAPEIYAWLLDVDYLILHKKHKKLSEIMGISSNNIKQ